MPRYEKDSTIKILKKEYIVNDLIQPLANYPVENVKEFFNGINLSFPRELRIHVLKETLRQEVLQTRVQRATLADEMNYRLSWFNQFTEVQLNNLFKFYQDPVLEKRYLENLWLSIIEYITDKSISANDFTNLIEAATSYSKKEGLQLQDVLSYNNTLNPLFFDSKGHIDGLNPNTIRPVLYKSSTITEIRELGLKYNVDVPKRLRKAELLEIILAELKDRNEYTEEKETALLNMNIVVMQRYAIKNNIKASTELKKEEVIEYILANAENTKEAYFIPSNSVYEVEAHDVGEAMPEIVQEPVAIAEPVVIEEEPVVVEETPVEPEPVKEVVPVIDQETLDKLFASRETVVQQTTVQKEVFDYTTVEQTHLNIVEYHGEKPKQFSRELNNIHDNTEIDTVAPKQEILQVELVEEPVVKKRFTLGRFLLKVLLNILIILVIIFIIIVIYAGITYKGTPNALIGTENAIANIYNKVMGTEARPIQAIREFLITLLKLKV